MVSGTARNLHIVRPYVLTSLQRQESFGKTMRSGQTTLPSEQKTTQQARPYKTSEWPGALPRPVLAPPDRISATR
jgi:hypothetical protein